MVKITHWSPFIILFVAIFATKLVASALSVETITTGLSFNEIDNSKYPKTDIYVSSILSKTAFSTESLLKVGQRTTNSSGKLRSLLQFDTQDILTDSTIISATFSLYLAGASTNDPPMPVTVFRTILPWGNNTTWVDQDIPLFVDLASTTSEIVTQDFKWYEWDVKEMLQKWANIPNRSSDFGIQVRGVESEGNRFRTFWSNDCTSTNCVDLRPKLAYIYHTPTSTPVPPTPTLTPTSTPTPGISSLTLRADPSGEINRGGQVTYTIDYRNGASPIFSVRIENIIPSQLELITDSFTSTGDAFIGTPTIQAGRITWGAIGSLPGKAIGSVSYRAQRPTLTATSTTTPSVTNTASPTATNTTTQTITSTITPTVTNTTTPTITSTITPTVTGTTTPTMAIPTSTATDTYTPTSTNTPTPTVSVTPIPTVSATPTPTSSGTPGASQITVEVVAIPKDPQNFDYFGSLGTFTLDDAVPDDSDSIPKLMTFTWDNPAIPMMVSQKAVTNWTNVQFTCYPSISSSIKASAQSLTAILSANSNLYCVFINVRSDQQNLASTQATVASIVAAVSQGTVVSTPVPTIPPPTLEPIINQGATMFWTYPLGSEVKPGSISSNSTQNPSIQIYLPIIAR